MNEEIWFEKLKVNTIKIQRMVIPIETYYLVDYENVGNDGCSGWGKLNKTDHIHLFYTENAKRMDLDIFSNHGEAELVMHKVPAGKQSVDMHMVSYLGYRIGIDHENEHTYVIVSRDKDYDNIIKFWKEMTGAKVSRVQKINQSIAKQKTSTKQVITENTSTKKSPVKVDKADKTKLNQEVQHVLSKAHYKDEVISSVAKIVASHYGKEGFITDVHNALEKKYENYLEVYGIIKSILDKYASAINTATDRDNAELNKEIQQILSKAGQKPEVINDVASIVVKNAGVKNNKQQIYRTIMKRYGQKKGLDIYTRIKKHIP